MKKKLQQTGEFWWVISLWQVQAQVLGGGLDDSLDGLPAVVLGGVLELDHGVDGS